MKCEIKEIEREISLSYKYNTYPSGHSLVGRLGTSTGIIEAHSTTAKLGLLHLNKDVSVVDQIKLPWVIRLHPKC